jgi:hypothetical protein
MRAYQFEIARFSNRVVARVGLSGVWTSDEKNLVFLNNRVLPSLKGRRIV